ncbi:MAG: hypothetical protein KAR32_04620 [Candidatus Omnitrophica bacterium]|nr:hypothetical protein [Candidatus Omnitrophota bacterium]
MRRFGKEDELGWIIFGNHVRMTAFFALEGWKAIEKRVWVKGFEEGDNILREEFFSFARRAYVFNGFVVVH